MSFEYVKGSIVELVGSGEYDVFLHGCNCFNIMGAGVAKIVKHSFPSAYEADQSTTRGDRNKLGTYSIGIYKATTGSEVTICNGYTQYKYGFGDRHFDYNSLIILCERLRVDFKGKRILMVKIGSGLAGGDWIIIEKIVSHLLGGECSIYVIDY